MAARRVRRFLTHFGKAGSKVVERAATLMEFAAAPYERWPAAGRDLTEHHLEHLSGFAGSRPVLVGDDAWRQRQNDVHGEALSAAWLIREHLDPIQLSGAGR